MKNMIREKSLLPIRFTERNRLARIKAVALLAVGLFALPTTASSAMVGPLTFEGVGDQGAVGSFYDGGGGGNLGIVFSGNAFGLEDSDVGGTGSFENEPSPNTIMYFTTGSNVTIDYVAGFTNALSFSYTAIGSPGSVSIYDGAGGTGNLLSSQNFLAQDQTGCTQGNTVCVWSFVNVLFSGTARSIVLGGTPGTIGFDNITLDPAPVPLPAAAWLLLSGLAGLGFVGRRRTAS